MSCLAKRAGLAGDGDGQVFQAQATTFEPLKQSGQPVRKPYLYSNYSPNSNEPADSDEESGQQEPQSRRPCLQNKGPDLGQNLVAAAAAAARRASKRSCGDVVEELGTFKGPLSQTVWRNRPRHRCDSKQVKTREGQRTGGGGGGGGGSGEPTTAGEERRNSLESIESRLSTSSGTNELVGGASSPDNRLQSSVFVVGARHLRPAASSQNQLQHQHHQHHNNNNNNNKNNKDDDDQLISVTNWHSIPLRDEAELTTTPTQNRQRAEPTAAIQRAPRRGRLSSLVATCKMIAGRASDASKQLAPGQITEPQEGAQGADETGRAGRANGKRPSGTGNGQQSGGLDGTAKQAGGPPDARRPSKAASLYERKGSVASWKSAGTPPPPPTRAQKQQIGKKKAPFLFAGILASILGSVFFSMSMLTIKLLPDGHGLVEKTKIVCFRGCILMLMCAMTIIYQKSTFKIRRDEIWVNVLRSVFGFVGVFGAYISLKYISIGDSTALVFSSPVWTSLLSHFILNEPLQWIQLVALPASLVGIILIAHPALLINMDHSAGPIERQPLLDVADVVEVADLLPLLNETSGATGATGSGSGIGSGIGIGMGLGSGFGSVLGPASVANASAANILANLTQGLNRDLDTSVSSQHQFDSEHRWKGIVTALGTSFIVSLVYIVLKFRKSTPIQTTTFWLGVTTVFFSLIIMCFVGVGQMPRGLYEWTLLIINGVCSWLGQVLLQWGLAYEDASVLSVIRTLDVAMTFTLSALFLHEEILWTSVLGAAIIACVVVSIMINSWLMKKLCPSRPAEHEQADFEQHSSFGEKGARYSQRFDADHDDQKSPLGREITLKLEAPSIGRKLGDSEAAA